MSDHLIVAGNWKMNLGLDEAEGLSEAVVAAAASHNNVEVAVFPPFPWLVPVRNKLHSSAVKLGAQNCYIGCRSHTLVRGHGPPTTACQVI